MTKLLLTFSSSLVGQSWASGRSLPTTALKEKFKIMCRNKSCIENIGFLGGGDTVAPLFALSLHRNKVDYHYYYLSI